MKALHESVAWALFLCDPRDLCIPRSEAGRCKPRTGRHATLPRAHTLPVTGGSCPLDILPKQINAERPPAFQRQRWGAGIAGRARAGGGGVKISDRGEYRPIEHRWGLGGVRVRACACLSSARNRAAALNCLLLDGLSQVCPGEPSTRQCGWAMLSGSCPGCMKGTMAIPTFVLFIKFCRQLFVWLGTLVLLRSQRDVQRRHR